MAKKTNEVATGNLTPKFLTVVKTEGGLDFVMGDGKTLSFEIAKCGDVTREAAMFHGFNQKIRDAAAGFSKTGDFSGARAEMADVIESLYAGDWNRRGGGGTKMEDLAAAIAEVKGASIDAARAAVQKASPEQREVWAKNGKVKLAMERIKQKRLEKEAEGAEEPEINLE